MIRKLFFFAVVLLAGCGVNPFSPEEPAAMFEVTAIDQPHYDVLGVYGIVTVYYKISNCGNVNISYYKVWFKVTCKQTDRTFREWTNGAGVGPGDTMTAYAMIDVAGKQYATVTVDGYELQ